MKWRLKEQRQWNKELVLWKDKQNWQILSQTNQKKERTDPN
jgi:hypothetical protein